MNPAAAHRLKRLNALLESALALPQAERAAWLRALPDEDATHAPALAAMLARAVATDDFLRAPLPWIDDETQDAPGDRIGPWRLLGELGRGGMSTVWHAERIDGGLQRAVALKLPRASWAQGIARRMARERDILATLEHPRIARLYDAGLAPLGRPWLAMERIDGLPIDRHAREHALSIDARLRLFLQVAEAVAYAHARLVVHRDLKPSNILVTREGEARLLDFGVAQLLAGARGRSADPITRQSGRPLTPEYAAPELFGTRPVGTAADVYSLGVVLFELLTGQRPHDADRAHADLTNADDAPLASRRAPAGASARALRGDLDAIVAKALRPRPADRYSSVEAFAADVQRHLDGKPVLAQRASWRYRALKFVRRHRLPLAAAGAVVLSLCAGLGSALWQADLARREAARAEQAKQFVASILQRAQPREGSGGAVLALDLLQVAGERIETELAADERTAAELGVTIAEGLSRLGDPQLGLPIVRLAVARAERTWGLRHPITVRGRALLAESLSVQYPDEAARVADALVPDALAGLPATIEPATMALREQSFQRAKRDEAEASYAPLRQAIELGERHLGANHEDTVYSMGLLSNTYGRFGRHAEQLATASEALTRAQAGLGLRRPQVTLTAAERWYAEALRRNDRPADALPILRRVVQDQRQLDGADTMRVRNAIYQLGLALAESGQLGEAMERMRETIALEAQQNTVDNEDRTNFRNAFAVVLGFARRSDEALALLGPAASPAPLPAEPALPQMVMHLRLAVLRALRGEAAIAAALAEEAVRRADDAHGQFRAEGRYAAALNARLQTRGEEAVALGRQAWDEPGRARARPAIQAAIAAELASALIERGDFAGAEPLVRRSLALYEQAQVAPSARSATAWVALARLHLRADRAGDAEAALRPLRAAWEATHPQSDWHGETLHWLARAARQRGDLVEARSLDQMAKPWLRASALPALRALAKG